MLPQTLQRQGTAAAIMRPVFLWRLLTVGMLFGLIGMLGIVIWPVTPVEAGAVGIGTTAAGMVVGGFLDIRALGRRLQGHMGAFRGPSGPGQPACAGGQGQGRAESADPAAGATILSR